MDRRQIDDVEAHLGDVREPARGGRERAVARRRVDGRAWEEFVPGGEARERALDDDLERRFVNCFERAVRGGRHELAQRFRQGTLAPLLERRIAVERRCVGEQSAALGAARPRGRGTNERGAFAQRDGDVVALRAPQELVAPGRERVEPGGDGVAMAAERGRDEARRP